ncbi:VOC family protein [Glaciibacter flavus]|uniref:VOC family protein n=1 Tax=Orlajensenia flava TaxID=2565934 RepID=UPI003AFF7722
MSVTTTTHINFRGRAREALDFYASVFGGDVVIATYADIHQVDDPAQADNVAWGQVRTSDGFRIMAYDVQTAKPFDHGQNSFYVALSGTAADETQRYWDGLADDATVLVPLAPAAFAPLYGMLTDRFDVTWIVDVPAVP